MPAETVVDVSVEKNSTLVMPFPVEMLRFFEHQSREPDGEYARRIGSRSAQPELTVPVQPVAPVLPLSGGRVGSGGERIGSRAAVARERRDNWPARAGFDPDGSRVHG